MRFKAAKGAIYILWDVADYKITTLNHTITLDDELSDEATAGSLAIYGAAANDKIGIYAPDFLQIGGTAGESKLDMIIRSHEVNKPVVVGEPPKKTGAIYILWDVADYYGTGANKNKSIDLGVGNNDNDLYATSGLLTIYGTESEDYIGTYAPDFLQIGGATDANKLDMVIRSLEVNNPVAAGGSVGDEGAIYILWDVVDYAGKNKTIDLGDLYGTTSMDQGATLGSLAIYGAAANDKIGIYAPDFLQIGGKDGYDMIIRSDNSESAYILWDVDGYYSDTSATKHKTIDLGIPDDENNGANFGLLAIKGNATQKIGKYAHEFLQIDGKDGIDMVVRAPDTSSTSLNLAGAVYILWDIADYKGLNKTIDLNNLGAPDVNETLGVGATAGSLAIYGEKRTDWIGYRPVDVLQIAGNEGEEKYDMVISSRDTPALQAKGAIYILWDVNDYYSDVDANKNKSIHLNNITDDAVGAASGLLKIYGKRQDSRLSDGDKYIIYGDDADGNKTLTDIDKKGVNDIAFKDEDYTYILFGEKVAVDGDDADDKIDSKTIDLAQVNADGFFGYGGVENVGYRFADRSHTALAAVQEAYEAVPNKPTTLSSDTGTDLGVWDIA